MPLRWADGTTVFVVSDHVLLAARRRNDEVGPLRRRENGKSKPLPVESAGRGLHQWSEARPQDAGENRVV